MRRFISSVIHALAGIRFSLRDQANLKIQVFVTCITVGAGFYFHITDMEWCIILLAIGLVISLEVMNTAVENLVNLVTMEWKPLAGKAKDLAAGAVLFASIIAVIIGVVIFRKYVLV
jgi:diacylglycerol kinase